MPCGAAPPCQPVPWAPKAPQFHVYPCHSALASSLKSGTFSMIPCLSTAWIVWVALVPATMDTTARFNTFLLERTSDAIHLLWVVLQDAISLFSSLYLPTSPGSVHNFQICISSLSFSHEFQLYVQPPPE